MRGNELQPDAKIDDFLRDLRGAIAGSAAEWCFHNGDQRNHPDKMPRRSFDLREKRLYEQLDETESAAVKRLRTVMGEAEQAPR